VLAALLTAGLYAVSLGGTFIYDDQLVANLDERLHDVHLWRRYLIESYNNGVDNLYRPLTSLSFAAQWQWGGGQPWLFHLVNLILGAGCASLVAVLAQRLARWRYAEDPHLSPPREFRSETLIAGVIAGLVFAAHPLHVEAVAYISGRAELLSAMGTIGALILFMKRPMTWGRALGIVGCCALATLSKEQGLLAPLMLVVMAYCSRLGALRADQGVAAELIDRSPVPCYPTRRKRAEISAVDRLIAFITPGSDLPTQSERGPTLLMLLLICWGYAGYILFRNAHLKFYWDRWFLDWSIQPMVRSALPDRWLMMPLALMGRYAALMLFPLRLSPDYGGTAIGWHVRANDPYWYLGAAALLAWCVFTIRAWRRRDGAMLFSLIGLGIFYLMIGNILTLIGTNFGERLAYLPSAFAITAAAIALSRWMMRIPRPGRAIISCVVVLSVTLFSVRTVTYARQWNDALSFYQRSAAAMPGAIRLHMLVASEYYNRGQALFRQHKPALAQAQFDLAAAAAERGRENVGDYYDIWVQSAQIDMARGRFDSAQQYLDRAMKLRPSNKVQGWMEELGRERAATQAAATQSATQRSSGGLIP
jgi:hypothetical protein